jgi:ABC-type multidrug transport system permease subunit
MRNHQLRQLLLAHFKEIIREPGVIFWGILFPILMSLGLGIAFTKKQDTTRKIAIIPPSVVVDSLIRNYGSTNRANMGDSVAHTLLIKNDKLGDATFNFYRMKEEEAITALKQGKINVILSDRQGRIDFRFDPQNPDAQLSYLKLSAALKQGKSTGDTSNDVIQPLTVKGTRYIDFLIPGLLAMGIMMSTMWGLSYGIIEKRSKKLLRRMVATPMRKSYFLFSYLTVRMVMNFIEAVLLIVFAWLVFDISIQGSIPALLLVFIAGNIGFAGLAIFISCRTAKTEIGNGLINVIVMPMMLLSGIFFSYHNFPERIIPIIRKLPLTMVADGMRSIFIEEAGLLQVAVPVLFLTIGGFIFFSLGLRFFRWY